jgi:Dockerin type I domain
MHFFYTRDTYIQLGILCSILGIFCVSGLVGYAQSSPNFQLGGGSGNGGAASISGNFVQDCGQISSGPVGQGSSSNFSVASGVSCITPSLTINFRVAPEKRIPISGLNLGENTVSLKLFVASGTTPVYTHPTPITIDNDGYNTAPIVAPVGPGQYDIAIKSAQHLTRKFRTIILNSGINTLDLTNSLSEYLKAGDVNAAGLGDDAVNALDISKEINQLGSQPLQQDLNRDGTVNALDIGILLKNLGQIGD